MNREVKVGNDVKGYNQDNPGMEGGLWIRSNDHATSRELDLILGTDFMIPSEVCQDLFNSTAKLPEELVVPLLKSAKEVDEQGEEEKSKGDP